MDKRWNRRANILTDGQMDRWTDGWADTQTDEKTEKYATRLKDMQTRDSQTDGQTDRPMKGQTNKPKN